MSLSNSAIWKSAFIALTAALVIAFALPTRNASGPESATFAGGSLLGGSKAPKPILTIFGSPQEFDGTRILGCFLEDHKFGPGRGHALGLQ
jgi:hypothetical protein